MGSAALAGRVALVTGGASGLGRATCLALAAEGATVIVADIDDVGAKATADSIEGTAGAAVALQFDVTDDENVREDVGRLFAQYGAAFNMLVNVAGIDRPGTLDNLDMEAFRMVNRVNYEGPVHLMNQFVNQYKETAAATPADIVNVISISAITVGADAIPYNSSKAAFAQATKVAQRDAWEHRIPCRIQGIMPAAMDTPMMEQWGIAKELMMDPAWVAAEIVHAVKRPVGCYAQNLVITPVTEPNWPR